MVRRPASLTSSWSSNYASWSHQDDEEGDETLERSDTEHSMARTEREVARRVLRDLEELFFDEDDEFDDGDDFDWNSKCDSTSLSSERSKKQNARGMTIEELTVAVNASIEHHRPRKLASVRPQEEALKTKRTEQSYQQNKESCFQLRHRHNVNVFSGSHQAGELVLESFREMLEQKRRHFYDLKAATKSAVQDAVTTHPSQVPIVCQPVVAGRQQQTIAHVRDQATETDECSQVLDASFTPAPFCCSQQSQDLNAHIGCVDASKELLIHTASGPTLADLAEHRRRRSITSNSSSHSYPASESSWDPATSSSTGSVRKRISRHTPAGALSKRSSVSSRFSTQDKTGLRITSKHNSSSNASSTLSPLSESSRQSGRKIHHEARHHTMPELPIEAAKNGQSTQAVEDQVRIASRIASLAISSNPSQELDSPALINWELDLSNFAH